MVDSTDQPTEDALWWLSFERPQYPQAILSSADIQPGLQFRFYHSHWSGHHQGLRLFDSSVVTAQGDVFSDHTPPSTAHLLAPRSIMECYNHTFHSKVNYALSDLGLEPHHTEWGLMWGLSGFCTSIEVPQMRWDEPRPNYEGMLDVADLQPGRWIYYTSGGRNKRLMEVMSEVTHRAPGVPDSAYGGLAVELHDRELQRTSEWALEDLGILPYMNPNGERWGDNYCTLASAS